MTEPNKFYPILAEKYGITPEEVRQILWFFYREGLAKALDNFVNAELFVSKLGSFKIKEYRLHKEIVRIEEKLKTGLYQIEDKMEHYVDNLKRMQESCDNINQKKIEFDELYFKDSRNPSEQKQDMGGTT